MPDSDKDRRTPEEIKEHYKQKEERRHRKYAKRVKVRERGKVKDRRELRLHAEYAERIRLREKAKRVNVREKKLAKERVRRRHRNGRYAWNKLSDEKKAEMAAFAPWDL